ncbi:MAG: hypothetical protein ACRDG5_02015 [Anaerolineales bacterium]
MDVTTELVQTKERLRVPWIAGEGEDDIASVGQQQGRMSLASFLSRRLAIDVARGETGRNEGKASGTMLRVHWSGPCPYCHGPNYRESIVSSGGAWLIEGGCPDCRTRRHAYRPMSG